MAILKLTKEVELNGKKINELDYDLENLKGNDVKNAVAMLARKGIIVQVAEVDLNYHAAVFAQAANISFEDMELLSAKDYNRATIVVRDFFLANSEE